MKGRFLFPRVNEKKTTWNLSRQKLTLGVNQSIQVQLALPANHLCFHFCLGDFLRGVCVFHRSSAPEVQCSCSLGVPDDHVHAVVVPVQTQQDADLLLLASRCEWCAQHLQNSFISAAVMTSTCRCVLWNESGLSSIWQSRVFSTGSGLWYLYNMTETYRMSLIGSACVNFLNHKM